MSRTRPRKHALPLQGNHAAEIIKRLEKNTSSGHRPDAVYMDWLELVQACLKELPHHIESLKASKTLAEDSPETKDLFSRLRTRYKDRVYFDRFAEAFAILLDSVDPSDPADIIGDIYMEFGYPNSWAGQFFTPIEVARLMAMMTMGNIEQEVHTRLKAAIEKSPLAQAFTLAGLALDGPETQQWLIERVIPTAIEHYDPVTVLDPCCGSGVMFLAAAATIPHWMNAYGLVQYFGQDIDRGCVLMAQINCQLYGLNGWGVKWALALDGVELQAIPEPFRTAYAEAQTAHQNGNTEKVESIAKDLRAKQISLFS